MVLRGTIPEPIAAGRLSRLLAIMSGVFLAGVAGMTGGALLGIGWPAFLIALSNLPPPVVVFDFSLLMPVFWLFALFVIIASLQELYVRRVKSVFVWAPFGLIAVYLLLGVFTWVAWNMNRAAESQAQAEKHLNIERARAAA